MGNRVLCSEVNLRCTQNCTRIALGERLDGPPSEGQSCEPAGAVFEETLEGLTCTERQLLLFSSSANAVAVRWLLRLGANPTACDSNGTGCLHAACRSGSAAVAEALLAHGDAALGATDAAGWTPLHVAAFMGRAELAALLLRRGAPQGRRTLAGRGAAELCSDAKTRDLIAGAAPSGAGAGAAAPRAPGRAALGSLGPLSVEQALPGVNLMTSREVRFEPFFVPRSPVIAEPDRGAELTRGLMAMARSIFDRQPGRGLAFLVASGCVRDYPINLVGFLRSGNLDPAHIGAFLGEDFSLSKILRMEFINTVGFTNLGVISSLKSVFTQFDAPHDLQKLDRILGSLADVWWRQHCRMAANGFKESSAGGAALPEPRGMELKRLLPNAGTLHQLLFSTVMLHWSLHAAPLPSQCLGPEEWLSLNRGIAGSRGDLPEDLLRGIYEVLSTVELRQLRFCGDSLAAPPPGGGAAGQPPTGTESPGSALAAHAQVEGWVRVTGSGLPAPLGTGNAGNGIANSDCVQLSHMLSEATASSRKRHPDVSEDAPRQGTSSLQAPAMQVWLSLCDSLLFLSTRDDGSPFAFVHLRSMQFTSLEPTKASFSIDGGPGGALADPPRLPLHLVFLLPDGRWQGYEVPGLEVQVNDPGQLEAWLLHLTDVASVSSVL